MIRKIRNFVHRTINRESESRLRDHLEEIRIINADHGSQESIDRHQRALSKILDHCTTNVPYYKNLEITRPELHLFPVVDKNTIRDRYQNFRSDSYPPGPLFRSSTSGSTGTPFTVLHDVGKRLRHNADVRYFWDAIGHSPGSGFFYLKIWKDRSLKVKSRHLMWNIRPIDVFDLDDIGIGVFLERLRKSRPPRSILGYASALDRTVKYLEKHPNGSPAPKLECVVAMSETLERHTKKFLQNHFQCLVVSRYANLENGILAQQTLASPDYFLINLASYHIEILDPNESTPVALGETGRIVVTDLYNKAMPLVRYDTGDLGSMGIIKKSGISHYVLKKVEGRRMDAIYNTDGRYISSYMVGTAMWKYAELRQYQFLQLSQKAYKFKLNPYDNFSMKDRLIAEFRSYLGPDAEIEIELVNEIPLLSSGKRKKIVNLYRQENK